MATRPQTIGYALLDSPVGLAAWLLDHDTRRLATDRPVAFVWTGRRARGQSHPGQDPRQHHAVLADGHRRLGGPSYWEDGRPWLTSRPARLLRRSVPVGFTVFPGEIWRSAAQLGRELAYPNVSYFNEVDKGGHFAAWEEPQLFSEEVRAAFRSLR